jgi:hypothetical protein
MTIPSISNQYKPVGETYNVNYSASKSTNFSRKNSLGGAAAFYNLGNAVTTYNTNSSSLNSAKDMVAGDVGLFNTSQTNSYNASVALEKANENLETLFNSVASSNVPTTVASNTPAGTLISATLAATTTADGTNAVAQDLTPEQLQEMTKLKELQDLKIQNEQAQIQHRLQVAQQEADNAKAYADEQSKISDNAQSLLNNDLKIVSDKESLAQVSSKDVNDKQDIFVKKQNEENLPDGSRLNIEV